MTIKQLAKKVCIFAAVFYGTLFISGIFFTGLFSQIQGLDALLNNMALSFIIFILFFVSIPAAVAHYVTFLMYKNDTDTLDSKNRKRFTVVTTVLLGILLFTFTQTFMQPRFAPYTLQQVDESEFLSPTPTEDEIIVLLTKQIDTVSYSIRKGYPGTVNLYEEETLVWGISIPSEPERVVDFWYDKPSDTLIVLETRGPEYGREEYEQIMRYSLVDSTLDAELLLFEPTGFYSRTHILNYYPSRDQLLLTTQGGDGCGGWGEIWLLTAKIKRSIQETASGCNVQSLPRFVGFTGEQLVFARQKETSDVGFDENNTIAEIYTQHPLSLQKTTIIKTPQLPEDVIYASIDKTSPSIVLLSKNWEEVAYRFNLATRQLTIEDGEATPSAVPTTQ